MNPGYYDIAVNDYKFLSHNIHQGFYNNTLPLIQQIAEKLLKSILYDYELIDKDDNILSSHKLNKIYLKIKSVLDLPYKLDEKNLVWFTDFYFEYRYPGDDFIETNQEQEDNALAILENIFEFVNQIRKNNIIDNPDIDDIEPYF